MGALVISACAVAVAAVAAGKQQLDTQMLSAGADAPAYALPDQNGHVHTLAQDQGKVVLLAFYPADFTGGCTREAHSLSAAAPELKAMGVTVYGVSVQDPKSHKAFCEKEGIPYTLLADTEHVMSQAYGVLIPAANVANRVTYIVGPSGKVVYVDADVNSHLGTCGADWVAWLKAHPQASVSGVGAKAELGKPAPVFALPDVSTGESRSADFAGAGHKATVLLFVATRCPVSNAYNTRMASLAKQFQSKGVQFIGIDSNSNEPVTECAKFVQAHGFGFPWLKDAGNVVADRYDAHATPEAYVVNSKGILVYHGRIDDNMDEAQASKPDLANALNAVVAGRAVARARTIAFGCSIKRG